jgi:hypothetical protein
VLLGGDFKWNAKELKAGKGWWGNKFALQGRLKYIDVFNVPNLGVQLEANRCCYRSLSAPSEIEPDSKKFFYKNGP